MGWTSCNKAKGQTMDEFFEKEFGCEFIGKGALVNLSEYYRAFKGENGKIKVLVCLVHMGKGDFNFSFKAMDSDMGPCYYNCPERILNLVERPTNDWGAEWYDRCRAMVKRKAKAKSVQNLDIIKFAEGIEFNNGETYDTFIVQKQGRKTRLWTYQNNKVGIRVNFKHWQDADFQVVGAVEK